MADKPKLTYVTYHAMGGSTILGRLLPLLPHLQAYYDIELQVLAGPTIPDLAQLSGITITVIGREPFIRTASGKKRDRGLKLVWTMLMTAIRSAYALWRRSPEVVVIVKSLPAPVLAVWLWRRLTSQGKVILDVDDFELMANQLTSLQQRAAIHWAERVGARLSTTITAATPFLIDHFTLLTQQRIPVHLLPTVYSQLPNVRPTPSLQPPTLTYIGSISISSGHRLDLLPEILQIVQQKIPTIKLLIAGSGDDITALQQKFVQHKVADAVTWLGRFRTEEVPTLVAKTSLLVDPIDDSLVNRAKSSFRISLAAMYGWPIVTSNIGIRPYWLPDSLHDRFFAMPGDVQQYAEKIVELLNHPLRDTERQAMYDHVEQYNPANLAQRFHQLINAAK